MTGGTATSIVKNAPMPAKAAASGRPPDVSEAMKWLCMGTNHAHRQSRDLDGRRIVGDLPDEEGLVSDPLDACLERFVELREGSQERIAMDQGVLTTVVLK